MQSSSGVESMDQTCERELMPLRDLVMWEERQEEVLMMMNLP